MKLVHRYKFIPYQDLTNKIRDNPKHVLYTISELRRCKFIPNQNLTNKIRDNQSEACVIPYQNLTDERRDKSSKHVFECMVWLKVWI